MQAAIWARSWVLVPFWFYSGFLSLICRWPSRYEPSRGTAIYDAPHISQFIVPRSYRDANLETISTSRVLRTSGSGWSGRLASLPKYLRRKKLKSLGIITKLAISAKNFTLDTSSWRLPGTFKHLALKLFATQLQVLKRFFPQLLFHFIAAANHRCNSCKSLHSYPITAKHQAQT